MTNNRLGRLFNLTRFAAALLFFATFYTAVPTANAQWNMNSFNAPNPVTCIRWLQDEGARLSPPKTNLHKGVCGGGRPGSPNTQFISFCVSGAAPSDWAAATINPPASWNDGYISDFAFQDTLVGWAAVYGAQPSFYNSPQVSGILKTTDGGATWTFLTGPTVPPEVRGLYYSQASRRLFCSSGDIDDIGNNNGMYAGAWYSDNGGVTWQRVSVTSPLTPGAVPWNQRCYYTGFASSDGVHIVLATEGTPNPCSAESDPPNIPFWLYSADGGLTWKTSTEDERSWQPVGLKNTSMFFASSYNQTVVPPTNKIMMSPDNGKSWRPVSTFNGQGAVTEVMGGDPCIIVAPDSNSITPGNYFSADNGTSWNTFGGTEPVPPLDMRSYVGTDSIWEFQGKNVWSIALPPSTPIHFSTATVDFPNSGCLISDSVISIYGCNCTAPQNSVIQITDTAKQVVSGSDNFWISGLTKPLTVCGPATFQINYLPNSSSPDATDFTINYTVNGNPNTFTIHATGAGAQTDFTTNLGNKVYPAQGSNSVTLKTVPCAEIDTFITINNPTCTDFQIIAFDTAGGIENVIWVNKSTDVPLPVTVNAKGGSFTVPIHATTSKNGNYPFQIIVKTKSGNTIVEKRYFFTLVVNGPQVKPFIRTFDIHLPFACNGKGLDSAVYYFDTTCLPSIISNIHLKNITDPNFKLDLSKITFPDTLIPFSDAGGSVSGKTYFVRVPVHMTQTKPGDYSDSVIFEDQLTDGTVIRTRAYIHYKIDKAIDYTPRLLSTNPGFFNLTPCDSGQCISFILQAHDTCNFPDTLSSFKINIGSNGPQYKVTLPSDMGKTQFPGSFDTVVVCWPDGYSVAGAAQQGSVTLWYRNGTDSNQITLRWSGFVNTGTSVTHFEVDPASIQPITRGCDSVVIIDTLFNNACAIAERVDAYRVLSGPAPTSIDLVAGEALPNHTKVPVRIVYIPTPTDVGQVCGTIQVSVTDMSKSETFLDTIHWCVNVNVKPKEASVTSITGKTLACDQGYDTTVCVTNTVSCGEPVTFTSASTTVQGVTLSNVPFPKTLAPGETACFNVHVQPPANTPNAGTITGTIDVGGDIPQTVNVNFPYEACSHATTLKFDTTGRTLIVTPRCITANDTIAIFDSLGSAKITSITMAPIPAGYTFTPPSTPTTFTMNQGDRTYFVVTFNPDLGTSGPGGTVTIQYLDGDNNPHTVTIPISSLITGSHYNTSLSLSTTRATKIKPDMKDTQDFTITLQGAQVVPLSVGVQELQIKMKYNNNILIPKGTNPTVAAGWSTGNPYSVDETNGVLTFSVKPTADLTPGSPIATVTMTAAVSDKTSTVVTIDTGIYNPTDANFTRCTLAATSAGDQLTVVEDLSCTDSLTNVAMQGKLTPADNIAIVPNPAHKASGAAANLSFNANVDASGAVDIVDMTGKTVAELANGALSHGEHIYAIPTPQLAEGTYFARIQIGGYTVVRKFILQKD